jgi:hypothetical protein
VRVSTDPPRALAQRSDVGDVALFARDALEVLRDRGEKLPKAEHLGIEQAGLRVRVAKSGGHLGGA